MIPATADLRVLFVTDLHLSAQQPFHQDNWDMVLEWVAQHRPDLVVVGGDMILSDPDRDDDHRHARREVDRLCVPWLAIPGNHDVGDNIVSGAMEKRVDEARRQRWLDHYGCDYWCREAGEWTLIGVNAQTLNGDGLAAGIEQLEWLSATVAAIDPSRPVALFVHKPLFVDHPSEAVFHAHSLEKAARDELLQPFADRRLRLVACGHKHQYRAFGLDDRLHIWGPATSCINFPPDVKMWGVREVGFVELRLGQGEALGRVRQSLIGRDFLFRHESYVRIAEYGALP